MPPMSPRPNEPAYWRSLEQRSGDPAAKAFAEREFPEGASELPEVNRRTMLTLLGASVSLAGIAGCRRPVEKILPYVNAPEEVIPGVPRYFATTMPLGLDAYGVVVESHEGRPQKIEGNELHPATMGRSNAFIQAAPLTLYDPDRSQHPVAYGEHSTWDAFVSAWAGVAEQLGDGSGLAILTESWCSPTQARLRDAIVARYPNATWATYESVSEENVIMGTTGAAGTGGTIVRPVHHYDRARVLLTLDADPLQTEADNIRSTAGFAAGRHVGDTHASMNRLWSVEAMHSVTGANADHRMRLAPAKMDAFVWALAAKLGVAGASGSMPDGVDAAWVDALVDDLTHHRGESLVVAGRRQPGSVHALVFAINSALGNVGTTIDCRELTDAALPRRSSLASLAASMNGGEVTQLLILGGNPVYDAPADVDFAAAMDKVGLSIHLADHVNETSQKATWHLPRAQFLEAWSDARSADGTMSIVQPLVQPLFDGKSDIEILGLVAEGPDEAGAMKPGYGLVRATWDARLGGDESAWNRALHDGVLAGSALPAMTPDAMIRGAARPSSASGMEIVFAASPAVYDGRFANNAWLQELPESMTKITWDNAAMLSPATAAAQGLENGDRVTITNRNAEIELPVWVQPGTADDTVVLALGYGRSAAGRVGNGVGADVGRLRHSDAMDFDAGASIAKVGGGYKFGQTQDHGSLKEPDLPLSEPRTRPIVREASLDEYKDYPGFAADMVNVPHEKQLWEDPAKYDSGYQWGMTIDLNACTGCNACVVACQAENNIPVVGRQEVHNGREMHWLRVDRYFAGDEADPQTVFQAVPCMQCENAPCEQVCPVAATVHDDEGLNAMVYNRCIGTRYCANNCPYKVRRFNFFNFTKDTPEITKMAQNPDVTVRSRGVMEKCTFCVQRINAGRINAKLEEREIRDGEVRSACQQACPAGAIQFGNLLDPNAEIVKSKKSDRNYALLAELLTRPRTTYLAKIRNPHPALAPEPTIVAPHDDHGDDHAEEAGH